MYFPLPSLLLRWLLGLAALGLLLLPAAAQADDPPTPISAGAGADWGVKESFRNYVLGPIAHGSISVSGGASQNPGGSFHFPVAAGEYDPVNGATVLAFSGAVLFQGHDGALEVTISDPRVELTPEGGALYADMASKPNIPGASSTTYPNVQVADLDLSGKTPAVDATTTTWPALPSALTNAAVSAFAGFYGAGTTFDPFAFGYEGPGGVPQRENWTPAGSPLWGKSLAGTIPSGVGRAAFDPARDRIWVGSYDGQKAIALNAETLAATGTDIALGHHSRNVAVDRTDGSVYSVDADLRAIRDSGSGYALDPPAVDTLGAATNALATDPNDGTIYTVVGERLLRYEAPGFAREEFAIPAEYGSVQVTDDGEIFLIPSGAPAVAEVTISGSTATLDPVPGTAAASGAAISADGNRIAYLELDYSEYPTVHTTLHDLSADGSGGWTDNATSAGLNGLSGFYGSWSGDGKQLFLVSSSFNDVVVIEDGAIVGRVKNTSLMSALESGPDGHVYALWRDGTIARLGVTATSPTVATEPGDARVTLASAAATQAIEFSAAATGDPVPSLQWQRRAPGSARWSDLEGESGETLAVTAGAADSGAHYRAVFANAAGTIASAAASLTVQVTPPGATPDPVTPAPAAPGPPDDATTRPSAAPQPRIAKLAATRKVGRSRTIVAARLTCPLAGGRCTVTAPRRVRIKIDGERFGVGVLAPKSLAPGSVVALKARLSKRAAAKLRGHTAKLRLRVVLSTADGWAARTIRVKLKKTS